MDNFKKTLNYITLFRNIGAFVPERYKDALAKREKDTYTYSHPKLNVSKKDFFTDTIKYVYDHDTIHLAVKHLEYPAYEYYKEDKAEVNCSRDLFFSLDENTRLLGVLEESYVLALERSQIPNNFNIEPKKSFDIALSKVCTSITSGWFREYAYDNYDKVQSMYNDSYVSKFKDGLELGIVKPIINDLTNNRMM